MEDYLGGNLVGEMESSKIIQEVNLFCNRPCYPTRFQTGGIVFTRSKNETQRANSQLCLVSSLLQVVVSELVNDLPTLHGTTQPNSLFKALSNTDDRAILKKQLRTKNRQLFSLWQRTYGCFSSSLDLARPLNQTVMGLYRWEPLIASNHPAKSGGLLQVEEKYSGCSLLSLKRMT